MAKVVLHIGTHKTATTTIQDMFARNAALLASEGVIYPDLYPDKEQVAGHHGLVMDWNPLPGLYALPGGSLAALQRIAEDHAAGPGTVFLSSEEFSRGRDGARVDFAALRAALAPFESIEVVCVLREQWQFVQSIYLEVSKIRVPPRPPQFVETVLREDMVEGLWTDYNLLYDHLLKTFSPDEIHFLDYDACTAAPGGIIGQMLRHLGLGLTADQLELVNEGRSNASPRALPAWAANIIAEPRVAPPWLIEACRGAFTAQFGPEAQGHLWTREEFRSLRDYAQERNGLLAARLEGRQPGFALHLTNQRDSDIYREDLRADFWMRCSRWMFSGLQNGQVPQPTPQPGQVSGQA